MGRSGTVVWFFKIYQYDALMGFGEFELQDKERLQKKQNSKRLSQNLFYRLGFFLI